MRIEGTLALLLASAAVVPLRGMPTSGSSAAVPPYELRLPDGTEVRSSKNPIRDVRILEGPDGLHRAVLWNEGLSGSDVAQGVEPWYALVQAGRTLDARRADYRVGLKSRTFAPVSGEHDGAAAFTTDLALFQPWMPLLPGVRVELEQLGVEFVAPVPEEVWIVRASAAARTRLQASDWTRWVGALRAADRIGPQLALLRDRLGFNGLVPVDVELARGDPGRFSRLRSAVQATGGELERVPGSLRLAHAAIEHSGLERLLAHADVLFVEVSGEPREPHDLSASSGFVSLNETRSVFDRSLFDELAFERGALFVQPTPAARNAWPLGNRPDSSDQLLAQYDLLASLWRAAAFGTMRQDVPRPATARAILRHAIDPRELGDKNAVPAIGRLWGERERLFLVDGSDPLAAFETRNYELTVPPGEPLLRATLAWTDAPASLLAESASVNDFDLRLWSPSAVPYDARKLGTSSIGEVVVETPEPGRWFVEVRARTVRVGTATSTLGKGATFSTPRAAYSLAVSGVATSAQPPPHAALGGCTPIPANLCAWWQMVGFGGEDDFTGNYDLSCASCPLTFPNFPCGTVRTFNGASTVLTCPLSEHFVLGPGTDLTIEGIVEFNGSDVGGGIISYPFNTAGSFSLTATRVGSGFELKVNVCDTQVCWFLPPPSTSLIPIGVPTHIALTIDDESNNGCGCGALCCDALQPSAVPFRFTYWINGAMAGGGQLTLQTGPHSPSTLDIGRGSFFDYLEGSIWDLAAYGRVLSMSEIGSLASAGICGKCTDDCDGNGVPDNNDPDSDGDGAINACETCDNDPNKTSPGACGCGSPDVDSDGDGVLDCFDGCPNDANKIAPGDCGCGTPDTDTDADGTADCDDNCPTDPNKTEPGDCGCNQPETDTDGDGVPDCLDICPFGDDTLDDDGDGVPNDCDNCSSPNPDQADCDRNGVGDVCDVAAGANDCNLDGVPDVCQDGTWQGGNFGSFLQPSNWDDSVVPSSVGLIRNSLASDRTAVLSGDHALCSLGVIGQNGKQTLIVSGSRLDTTTSLQSGSTAIDSNGALQLASAVVETDLLSIADCGLVTGAGRIEGGALSLLRIDPGGRLQLDPGDTLEVATGGLAQAGRVVVDGGVLDCSVPFINDGIVEVVNGGLLIAPALIDQGVFITAGSCLAGAIGSLVLDGGIVDAGIIARPPGGVCTLPSNLCSSITCRGTNVINGAVTVECGAGLRVFSGSTVVQGPVLNDGYAFVALASTLQVQSYTQATACGAMAGDCIGAGCSPAPEGGGPRTLIVADDVALAFDASFAFPSGVVRLGGDFDVAIDAAARLDLGSTAVVFEGAGNVQELEVLAADAGSIVSPTDRTHFPIGEVEIAAGAHVRSVDRHVNAGGTEVTYVGVLRLGAGATLDLAGATIYYETLVQDPTATVTDSVGGGAIVLLDPPFTSFCPGDGSETTCPCANDGLPGHGCDNSAGTGGGRLSASGVASVSGDSVTLTASSLPSGVTALLFQGTQAISPVPFGDGLLCVTGGIKRLALHPAAGGTATFPSGVDGAISVMGQVPAGGGTRYYQVWYRDQAAFCSVQKFNTTSAVAIEWMP